MCVKNGVAETAFLKEDRAVSTWDNARFSRRVTDAAGLNVHAGLAIGDDPAARGAGCGDGLGDFDLLCRGSFLHGTLLGWTGKCVEGLSRRSRVVEYE